MSQRYAIGSGSRSRRANEGGRRDNSRYDYDDRSSGRYNSSSRYDSRDSSQNVNRDGGRDRSRGGGRGSGQDAGGRYTSSSCYDSRDSSENVNRDGGRDRGRSGGRGSRINSGRVDKPSSRSENKDGGRSYRRNKGNRGKGRGGVFQRDKTVTIVPHPSHKGIFIVQEKEDTLVTKNLVPGVTVYGEKKIYVVKKMEKVEYRVWNPFRFKLAAAIVNGIKDTYIKPGSSVLYLGASSATNISHISDMVGPKGIVYAVVHTERGGRCLIEVAQKRSNIIPIIGDMMNPVQYRMIVGMLVDVLFADVAQHVQAKVVVSNAKNYLKDGGHFILSIKANCIDLTTGLSDNMIQEEIKKLEACDLKCEDKIDLKPYETNHCIVVGVYKPVENRKKEST